MSDYDSPWKEILDIYFPEFLAFFFPDIHTAIDWTRPPDMLDKEFQQLVREAEAKRRTVDKLVRVWLPDGQEHWLLIHIEIQTDDEADFAERMAVYHFRIFDRYRRSVVSLAILGDDSPHWRPSRYERGRFQCRTTFEFPAVKLLDYLPNLEELERNANPFAVVVLAHLQTQRTRHAADDRFLWKLRLIRGLYERGVSRRDIINLWRFIDWVMELPDELTAQCWQEIQQIEQERKMPYMTSTERMLADRYRKEGRQEGLLEGRQEGQLAALREGIAVAFELKFGAEGLQLAPTLATISEVDKLHAILSAIKTAASLDEVRALCG